MPKQNTNYLVFLSSPSDVMEERNLAEDVIRRISSNSQSALRLTLTPDRWEHQPPGSTKGKLSIQDQINQRVATSDIFILVLGARYGSIEPGQERSNTEREVEAILRKKETDPRVSVLCYLKHLPKNDDPGPQETLNLEFRQRLQTLGILFKEYKDTQFFEREFIYDLHSILLNSKLRSEKTDCLAHFWLPCDDIDDFESARRSDLAIIYRPSLREYQDRTRDPSFWWQRLMPNIIFEDSKAIQKIQKMARLLSLRTKVHMIYNLPNDIRLSSRVWVGAPTMEDALEHARKENACFRFEKTNGRSLVHWTPRGASKAIRVKSPFGDYLRAQRKPESMRSEWNSSLGDIYVKDYAVLARLTAPIDYGSRPEGIYDYFVAGIRGLGTWGAAWFIDRKYLAFEDCPNSGRVEILLEVIYRRGAILDVIDVSDKPQAYFDNENKAATVRKNITTGLMHI